MGELVGSKQSDINQLLMKLERNQRIIHKFLNKLSSYTCEPTDYACFVRVDGLKHDLRDLEKDQQDLFTKLRRKIDLKDSYLEKIDLFLKRFQKLEQEMAEYILTTKKYY